MAKTFITSNKELIADIKDSSVEAGFEKFNEEIGSKYSIIAFNKLKVYNENFVSFSDGYISVSGTFFYKDKIGEDGLFALYDDFHGNVEEIRGRLVGNYLISIKKNDGIYLFGDENGIYNINYFDGENDWIVSNDLCDIARSLKSQVTVNEFNFLEQVFQNTILDNGTVYNEIKRLKGNEYIYINLKDNSLSINAFNFKPVKVGTSKKTLDEHVEYVSDIIRQHSLLVKQSFENITVSMTGGLDSRVVLSSFLGLEVKPNIVYGVGNTGLTNTKGEDLKINKIYESKFNLNFTTMDWSTPLPFDRSWQNYSAKYGMLSTAYCASDNVFGALEGLGNTDFIDFGYFGEPLRNIDWLESFDEDFFTLDEYLDDFYINKSLMRFYCEDKFGRFREHIYNKLVSICDFYNLSTNKIHKNEFQLLHNEYRKGADTVMLNFVNFSFYSVSLLSIKDVESAVLSLDFNYKTKSKFIIKLLEKLYPPVLDVPVFSHCHTYQVDKNNCQLKPTFQTYIKDKIKRIIVQINPNETLLDKLKVMLNKNSTDSDDLSEENIKAVLIEKLSSDSLNFIDEDKFSGDIRGLAKYVQMLQIINNL